MSAAPRPPIARLLDDGVAAVRRAGAMPAAVLAAAVLMHRFAQVRMLHVVLAMDDPSRHGHLLQRLAVLVVATLVVATLARCWYARACRSILRSQGRTVDAGRVPAADLAGALTASALLVALGGALLPLIVPLAYLGMLVPVTIAACSQLGEVRWDSGVRAALAAVVDPRGTVGIGFVHGCGALLAAVNIAGLAQFGLWLARGAMVQDAGAWSALVAWDSPVFVSLCLAGGLVVAEPFWLASSVALVESQRARRDGSDLRHRFDRAVASDAA